LLYLALGKKVPKFGHLPLILAPDGKRLSKRYGATSVNEFKDMGFLPEGLLNGLALLGWGDTMTKPIFTLEDLIVRFDLTKVNKKGAIFDIDKLAWINGQHLSNSNAQAIWPYVKPLWINESWIDDGFPDDLGIRYTDLLKSRMRLLNEFVLYGKYLFEDPTNYDMEAINKHLNSLEIKDHLSKLIQDLELANIIKAIDVEQTLRSTAEDLGIKASTLIHALRIAVTGFGVSPDIFEICEILGKETIIKRMNTLLLILS
jgi:glutamyl/glutaminyl-tRNA synthetase